MKKRECHILQYVCGSEGPLQLLLQGPAAGKKRTKTMPDMGIKGCAFRLGHHCWNHSATILSHPPHPRTRRDRTSSRMHSKERTGWHVKKLWRESDGCVFPASGSSCRSAGCLPCFRDCLELWGCVVCSWQLLPRDVRTKRRLRIIHVRLCCSLCLLFSCGSVQGRRWGDV